MTALPLPNFRGHEADEFTFYRIPKLLTTDERLRTISTDAKFLYGAMLDRMGLSIENGWLDEKGDVYIYYIMREEKPLERKVTIRDDRLKRFFSKNYTPQQIEDVIMKLLEGWYRRRQQEQAR